MTGVSVLSVTNNDSIIGSGSTVTPRVKIANSNFTDSAMPSDASVPRLLSYYHSSMFEDDFRRQMRAGGKTAAKYRQHLVDNMNENFAVKGYVPTAEDIALQKLFLEGCVSVEQLLEIARNFGPAGVVPHSDL